VSRDLEQGQKDRARNNEKAVAYKFHLETIFVQRDRPQWKSVLRATSADKPARRAWFPRCTFQALRCALRVDYLP